MSSPVYEYPDAEILDVIERHCNNYFNPTNDPNSSVRNYSEAFLKLATRIREYENSTPKTNIKNENIDGYSVTIDLENISWQKAFSRELSIYKRVKFI